MLTTEEEAKAKWCPWGRAAPTEMFTTSNPAASPPVTNREFKCIGSACMMWRWRHINLATTTPKPSDLGYCGLAGYQPW